MEQKKNFLQHTVQDNTLLPIEREMLESIKRKVEADIGSKILKYEKHLTHPLYDAYVFSSNEKPFYLKVSLSPFVPNFWKEICENNFDFHPKVVSYKLGEDFDFICYEIPKGIFGSDISKHILHPNLGLEKIFAQSIKKLHESNYSNTDSTIEIFDSFLPIESGMINSTFPVAQLFYLCKNLFKQIYKSSLEDCGICHFDLNPENLILTKNEFKFVNFEYAANANIYIDIWLTKELLNCSEEVFQNFVFHYGIDNTKLLAQKESADLFIFSYFNSKIISEYMTFGVANHIKLRTYINKSDEFYQKLKNKLFLHETLDKSIQDFYLLWRS
jgi:thiamine kinase-like enzyme